jgi:hypothetical protein
MIDRRARDVASQDRAGAGVVADLVVVALRHRVSRLQHQDYQATEATRGCLPRSVPLNMHCCRRLFRRESTEWTCAI